MTLLSKRGDTKFSKKKMFCLLKLKLQIKDQSLADWPGDAGQGWTAFPTCIKNYHKQSLLQGLLLCWAPHLYMSSLDLVKSESAIIYK